MTFIVSSRNIQTEWGVQKPICNWNVCDRDGVLAFCHCNKILPVFSLWKGLFVAHSFRMTWASDTEGREHMGSQSGPSLLGNHEGPTVPFKGMPLMSNVPLDSFFWYSTGYSSWQREGGIQSFLWATLTVQSITVKSRSEIMKMFQRWQW